MQKINTYHADGNFLTPFVLSERSIENHYLTSTCAAHTESCEEIFRETKRKSKPLLSSARSSNKRTVTFVMKVAVLLFYTGFISSYLALITPSFLKIDATITSIEGTKNNYNEEYHFLLPPGTNHSIGFFSYRDDIQQKTVMYRDAYNVKQEEEEPFFPTFDASFHVARISGVSVIFLGGIITLITLLFVFFFSRPFSTMLVTFSIVYILYTTLSDLLGIPKLGAIIIVAFLACVCIVTSFVGKSLQSSASFFTYRAMTFLVYVFQMMTFFVFNSNDCKENLVDGPFGGTSCSFAAKGAILSIIATCCWLIGTYMLCFVLSRHENLDLENPLKEQTEQHKQTPQRRRQQKEADVCAIHSELNGSNHGGGEEATCSTTIVTYHSVESLQMSFEEEEEEEESLSCGIGECDIDEKCCIGNRFYFDLLCKSKFGHFYCCGQSAQDFLGC
mmetsp:Transcript_13738/g.19222  ORF Transcript_13738/g.19222 Transcript_13738/m.19222 type:complete len:446 (+) Transcript_13738:100-1437(+)